jgi:hypothetical protein
MIINKHANHSLLITLTIFLLFPLTASAQMFSVGDPEPERQRFTGLNSVISVGWEFATFEFTGSSLPIGERLDFEDSVIRFRLDTPGLEISIGLGGRLTGMNENSLVNLNARLFNNLQLYRRENVIFFVPIQITTDLLRVSRNNIDSEFQQSSLSIGAGIGSALRLRNNIDFSINGTPNFGFSFSQGNLFGGSIFRFDGKAQFFFRNLIGRHSLSVGYHFDHRKYDIDGTNGDLNDHDFTSHSITLGYAF